jgi:dienelactone hydrolase
MTLDRLRHEVREFLRFNISDSPLSFVTHEDVREDGFRRLRISYMSGEGESIPAFLLVPPGEGRYPAVLVHHQHNGQRHFGKSEVCGLVGNPLQGFGPALVRRGMVVLAPDSICFEDRRRNQVGTEADDADAEQHYNEMCYRLLNGDTLMRKVLSDSAQGISLLRGHPLVDSERIGIMGHSYGGNTVLFHGALDERIHFACSSGAACSYHFKMANQLGIEMAKVIPGFATRFDIADLVTCFAPRPILIVSAIDDLLSQDAGSIVATARETCAATGAREQIDHQRYDGKHSLTQERFDYIVNWLVSCTV